VTDEWVKKYAELFENDEEREEVSKILEMLDQVTDHTITAGKAGKADPAMATVGEIDRVKDAGRYRKGFSECL